MSSQKLVFGVEYLVEKSISKELKAVAEEIQATIGGSLEDGSKEKLKQVVGQYEKIIDTIGSFDGELISPKAFDKINQSLAETTVDFEGLIKLITEEIALDIDMAALEELNDEIDVSEKKMESLEKKMRLGSKLDTDAGYKDFTKSSMDQKMSEKFSGFTGRTDSLEIEGLYKNRVEYEKVAEAYDKVIKKQHELETTTRKLTKAQKEELEAMQAPENQEKLKKMKEVLDAVDAEAKAEKEKQKKHREEHAAEMERYDEKIAKRKELMTLDGTKAGSELSGASTQVSKAKTDLKDSKFTKDVITEEQKNKERYDSSSAGESSPVAQEADELLAKYFSLTAALKMLQKMGQKTIQIIGELDAAFVSISVVTQYTNKQVWGMYDSFSGIASAAGFTVSEIGSVAAEYFRQGESYTNVLLLTEAAAKAAQVAGIDASDSVRYLTSAVKGYSLAASDAMMVSDKFAALSANTATNYEGLATAMSKVASQASASGVEMDNLMGMMATAMEVTQEAPENIGTAFKTILARMSEIKDYGKVLEDGVDANRVEKALKTVGVALFDNNNEMRALDDVLLEVGAGWGTLNRSQKAYIATSLAGTRQQTRLLAVLENMEMTEKNIQTSRNSAGATEAQQLKNTESLAFQFNRINVAYERFVKNISGSSIVVGTIKAAAYALESFVGLTDTIPGKVAVVTTGFLALGKAVQIALATNTFNTFKELVKSTSPMLVNMVAGLKSGTGALGAIGAAGGKAAALLAPLIPWIAGAALAGIGLAAAWKAIKHFSPEKQIERTASEIERLNAELYNVRESKGTTKSLVDEYEDLERQVVKTTESIQRQQEIIQLLEDADVDNKYQFRSIDGGLNESEVARYQEDLRKEENKLFEERMSNGLKLVGKFKHLKNEVDILNAAEAKAIQDLAGGSLEAWQEVDDNVKKMAQEWALAELEHGGQSYLNADGTYYQGEVQESQRTEIVGDDEKGYRFSNVTDYTGEDGQELTQADGISPEALERMAAYQESLDLSKISMAEYQEEMRKIAPEHMLMTDALYASADAFQGSSNISIQGMQQLGEAIDMVKGHGIELSQQQEKDLLNSYDPTNPKKFFSELQQHYNSAENATASFAHAVIQMQGIFQEITFEQIVDGLTTFESLQTTIDNVNASMDQFNAQSLEGAMALMDQYREYPELVGIMADELVNLGAISDSTQESMLEAEKQKQMKTLQMKIDENESIIKIKEAEAKMYNKLAEDETAMAALVAEHGAEVNAMSADQIAKNTQAMGGVYETIFDEILAAAAETGQKLPENLAGAQGSLDKQIGKGDLPVFDADAQAAAIAEATSKVKDAARAATEEVAQLKAENVLLNEAMGKIGASEWNTSVKDIENAAKGAGNAIKDTGKAADEAAEKIEYYTATINKLYVSLKKLELVNTALDLNRAKQAYLEAAAAAGSLAGAQSDLVKETRAYLAAQEYKILEKQINQMNEMIETNKLYQDDLVNKLDPALTSAYKIVEGKVIPVTKVHGKLTADNQKLVDEFAAAYNKLTDEVDQYKIQILEAAAAQNQLLVERRDKMIKYHEAMIEAIKTEEGREIEKFKKIIDANKKYLEDRKKLYEDSFKEEDKEEEAGEIDKKRLDVIEKMANLEAAHDLASIQRKESYRKELSELDDQYNKLMLDRNRDALITSLDDQITIQEEIYEAENEAYQERIKDGKFFEQRIGEIQDEARMDSILKNVGHLWTIESMLENGYITRKELAEAGILDENATIKSQMEAGVISQEEVTRLGITNVNKTMKQLLDEGVVTRRDIETLGIKTTNNKVNDLNAEQLKVFKQHWKENKDVLNKMWKGAGDEVGAEQLTKDAMENIVKYLMTNSNKAKAATGVMQEAIRDDFRKTVKDAQKQTGNFNDTVLTGPDYKDVEDVLDDVVDTVEDAAGEADLEYKEILVGSGKAVTSINGVVDAINKLNNKKLQNKANTITTTYVTKNVTETVRKGGSANSPQPEYSMYATGGTTERTGLHWLDGKPGAPERILSPGANAKFEDLLTSLTANQESAPGNDKVVDSLMTVVKAVYDSSQESAGRITEAIEGIETGDNGISIRSVAGKHGISLNRRGDR